jgi:hypothetical protein
VLDVVADRHPSNNRAEPTASRAVSGDRTTA